MVVASPLLSFAEPGSARVSAKDLPGPDATEHREVRQLIARLLPDQANAFAVEFIPAEAGCDVFEIESREGQIVLRGNRGLCVAAGLNWYLKHACKAHVSLKGRQLALPPRLPAVPTKVRRVSQDRWRYFLNYCCFGYSLPWYDWADWERLIDWMALQGINAPLSVTGQEAVWRESGERLGFTDSDLHDFLAGPPYLPFGWMGCLDGWGGPLPPSWVDRHAALQRQILARERALGMTPVLQGFTGHVPPATRRLYPNAHLHKVKWIEWETLLLDPLDPLFSRFATTFLGEQRRLFGTDHLYAADTFIEMTPPSGDTHFLAATARAIHGGMAKADPDAVWVLQGWTFFNQAPFWTQPRIEAFLNAVPDSQMVVLDLFCDVTPVWNRTRGFCGKPWIWCALQNFGDCVYLGGALNRLHADLPAARRDPLGRNLAGVGFVNEGLDYNPIIFDYLFEQSWRSEPVNLDDWVRDYGQRVCGNAHPDSDAAWRILAETAFTGQHQVAPVYTQVPSLNPGGEPPYSNERLTQAWRYLLSAARSGPVSDACQFALLMVTRQVLGNFSGELARQAADAWQAKDLGQFRSASGRMIELIRDLDTLLATRAEFLLGKWLADARRWGDTAAEKDRLEWNARRVITMWGQQTAIRDYSRREWSGMLTSFYLKRWERFYAALAESLDARQPFDQAAFDRELQTWELAWADSREAHRVSADGDTLAISQQLWAKHQPALARAFAPEAPSLTTGKPSTASSALPGHPASSANDGRQRNTHHYWATDIHHDPDPWWQVDFEKPTLVGRVMVVAYFGDERCYGFTVEGSSDGVTWEILADRRANDARSTAEGYQCTFAPQAIRYLRIRQTRNSANTGRHLVEVLAFEH
jgi:alpha-N-acetylglucosaminidase